jgi:hypothetical protein
MVPPTDTPTCAIEEKGKRNTNKKHIFLIIYIGLAFSLLNENVLNVVSF